MKGFLVITLFFICSFRSDDLFESIKFNDHGIGCKVHIPVIYQGLVRYDNDMGDNESIRKLHKSFRTTTALLFTFNDILYNKPIDEKKIPNFLSNLEEGDLIFIDIVFFDSKICKPCCEKYCSYVSKIQKRDQ